MPQHFLGADMPSRPQTTAELLELWRGALRSGERKMLDALVDVYPGTLSRAELGERTGYTTSGGTRGQSAGRGGWGCGVGGAALFLSSAVS
jgi:hypothetical protein